MWVTSTALLNPLTHWNAVELMTCDSWGVAQIPEQFGDLVKVGKVADGASSIVA